MTKRGKLGGHPVSVRSNAHILAWPCVKTRTEDAV